MITAIEKGIEYAKNFKIGEYIPIKNDSTCLYVWQESIKKALKDFADKVEKYKDPYHIIIPIKYWKELKKKERLE